MILQNGNGTANVENEMGKNSFISIRFTVHSSLHLKSRLTSTKQEKISTTFNFAMNQHQQLNGRNSSLLLYAYIKHKEEVNSK